MLSSLQCAILYLQTMKASNSLREWITSKHNFNLKLNLYIYTFKQLLKNFILVFWLVIFMQLTRVFFTLGRTVSKTFFATKIKPKLTHSLTKIPQTYTMYSIYSLTFTKCYFYDILMWTCNLFSTFLLCWFQPKYRHHFDKEKIQTNRQITTKITREESETSKLNTVTFQI